MVGETRDLPRAAVVDPRRSTWDSTTLVELRAMQEPGEPDLVAELLETFQADAAEIFAKLREHVLARDFAHTHASAHRIRGGALNLGAEKLARAAASLERAAQRGDASSFDELHAQLVVEHARFFDRVAGR